jgi:hypothetical protein
MSSPLFRTIACRAASAGQGACAGLGMTMTIITTTRFRGASG